MDCCFGEDLQVVNCDNFRDINLESKFCVNITIMLVGNNNI